MKTFFIPPFSVFYYIILVHFFIIDPITNLKETDNIKPILLRACIAKKITSIMNEYSVDNLDNICCFVILDKSENQMFSVSEMECVGLLNIGEKHYLHGVKILGDSYGEDIYLPIEVQKC